MLRRLTVFWLVWCVVPVIVQPVLAGESEKRAGEDGFVAIFDGKSLDGWQGNTGGYVAEDGLLICNKKGGTLISNDEYADFHLKFEFKLTPGANNGIGIRTTLKGNPAYAGMEIQVLDDTAPKYKGLKPYQFHGSIYGVVPAKRGHLKPVGEWNEEEIICRGSHVVVKLNGATIVDADVTKVSTPKTIDGQDHPGLKRKKGYVALCGHGAVIEFRNMRIKVLGDSDGAEKD